MYHLNFWSPAQEFDYGIVRYQNHGQPVTNAYHEPITTEDTIKLSERYVEESHELRGYAK